MKRQPIAIDQLSIRPHRLWSRQGLLLSCGDFAAGDFNAMTVGWGSIGRMWQQPFVQVVVRPTRYTHTYMERYDSFTLAAFPEEYRADLNLLGTKSGRDGDKIAETKLTPIASQLIAAPSYVEASLIIECRMIYKDQFKPQHFLTGEIEKLYPRQDYHTIYFGRIETVYGIDEFSKK